MAAKEFLLELVKKVLALGSGRDFAAGCLEYYCSKNSFFCESYHLNRLTAKNFSFIMNLFNRSK